MTEHKIQLGDRVRCKYTGYVGTVVARTEFINGCVQCSVASKIGKDNKMPIDGDPGIDEGSLEVIKPKKKPRKKRERRYGGPTTITKRMRGY